MPRTYVDNAKNRSLGRVGQEIGDKFAESRPRYVDNAYNRKLGRVDMIRGTMPVSSPQAPQISIPSVSSPSSHYSAAFAAPTCQERYVAPSSDLDIKLRRDREAQEKRDREERERREREARERREREDREARERRDREAREERERRDQEDRERRDLEAREEREKRDREERERRDREAHERHLAEQREQRRNQEFEMLRQQVLQMTREMDRINSSASRRSTQVGESRRNLSSYAPTADSRPRTDYYDISSIPAKKLVSYSDLTLGPEINRGTFGTVYKAKLDGKTVAVKKMNGLPQKRIGDFTREITILSQLMHPNIVRFLYACTEEKNICIVLEYMDMSLYETLHVRRDVSFNNSEKQKIITQMWQGLGYMHGENVAHCDIKPHNVLLNNVGKSGMKIEVKLSDFGLSKVQNSIISTQTQMPGCTYKYAAPEVLRGSKLSVNGLKLADVYSMAMVTFELASEQEPFERLNQHMVYAQVGNGTLMPDADAGHVEMAKAFRSLLRECWSRATDDRPSAKKILEYLETMNRNGLNVFSTN